MHDQLYPEIVRPFVCKYILRQLRKWAQLYECTMPAESDGDLTDRRSYVYQNKLIFLNDSIDLPGAVFAFA